MPNNHLSGQGCSKCSGKYKPNLTEFIEKCVKIHGNKYFYNKVNYINNYSKIILECPLHGDFSQTPNNHLMGQGCLKCSGNHKMSNLEFIKMSNDIHLNKYLYEKVNYTNCETKVEITCKKHGSFNQTPYRHLKGDGCSKCSGKYKPNTEEFIDKCYLSHGDKYIYDKVIYYNKHTKIIITCKEHGDFSQTPNHHLKGTGCPVCKKSKGEAKIENILKENMVCYKPQYSFPDLKYQNLLYFDFGIFDNNDNLKYLLEFNGEQHYKFKPFFHKTEEDFLVSQLRDVLKKDYCEKNNIPLYIIKYDEDINEKINKLIK